jgi:hypothetical protein
MKNRVLLIPVLGLALVAVTGGAVGAENLLIADSDYAAGDMDYVIVPTAHHGDCQCRSRRSQRLEDCYTCPPDSVVKDVEPEDEESVTPDDTAPETPSPEPYQSFRTAARTSTGTGRLPGYIDDARIRSRVRVRYDNMQGADEPTRAEFWYPTLGNFGGPGPFWVDDPANPGGSIDEVDFQELATYVEAAFGPSFSVFGEFPVRWVSDVSFGDTSTDPIFEDGTQAGAGDFRAGIRYGLIACPDEYLTLQVRAWAPTGEARRALGVGHSSIDIALLYSLEIGERTTWFAEIQDWQTLDADTADIAGEEVELDANVLRYGAGVGYDLWQSCGCRPQTLTGLFEVVGWTVLEGVTTQPFFDGTGLGTFEDAEGDTIINGKYGLRYSWPCGCHGQSFYVGYGHNWTEERWYSDVFRLELTHFF